MGSLLKTTFIVLYLVTAITMGVVVVQRARDNMQYRLFGIMAILLGVGDAVHLLPLAYGISTKIGPTLAKLFSMGALASSISSMGCLVLFYHVVMIRYRKKNSPLTVFVYVLASIKGALCLLPQNQWIKGSAPYLLVVARNIPFAIVSLIIIILLVQHARKGDNFHSMATALSIATISYLLSVLLPATRLLMFLVAMSWIWIILIGAFSLPKER